MADIVIPINKTVDISKGTLYTTLGLQNTHDQLIQGQSYANVLNVSVYDGAEPVALSGGCMGCFVRQQDGSTVTVAGTISGNVASVEFPSFVYAYTGRLTITLNVGGTSLVQIATTVRLGATMVVVDPGNVLPNIDEIQQIMLDVENALNQLSGALEASQAATQAANTAAGTANTAAQGANDAASAANTAASALNGLTATANTLEPEEPATAVAELVSGAWKITFGIPQGVQGIQGVRGTVAWHGTAITGTSTTPTAYPTGIDSAIAGDLYLYSGTDSANIGNVYTCTQGGNASTALWAYMANWRGATGAGSVSSVNSVLPNAAGDVELTAADVGARPDTWMPDGLIYETTAQALEAMSQEQQAELYAQGYRAIVATYNDTVTMHALAEDGSLAWIGCNQDTTNLPDNPDFSVAQAGYGGTHGVQVYAADRWAKYDGSATFSQASGGGLSIQMSQAGYIYQKLAETPSGNFTLAVNVGGVDYVATGAWPDGSGDGGIVANFPGGQIYADATFGVVIYFTSSCTIAHARLLLGSYTPKTLPPWVAPDPVMELLKCQRYYWQLKFPQYKTIGLGYEGPAYAFLVVGLPVPMRTDAPTLVQSSPISLSQRAYTFNSCSVVGSQAVIDVNYTAISDPAGGVYGYAAGAEGVTLEFCNDL